MKHEMTSEEERVLIRKYMDQYGFNVFEAKQFYNQTCESIN